MGNLIQKKNISLINSVDSDTLKLYDSNTKIQLNYPPNLGSGIVLDCETITEVSRYCTADGVKKAVVVEVNPPCPCDGDLCDYEFGLHIENIPKFDGATNHQKQMSQYYNAVLAKAVCSGAYLNAASLSSIRDQIINNIGNDTSPPAVVQAGMAKQLTGWNAASTISITIDGVTTPIAAGATIAAFVALINASGVAFAYLDPTTPATVLWVISGTNGDADMVVANTAGTVAVTAPEYIGLIALDVDVKFNVQFTTGFATTTVLEAGSYAFLDNAEMSKLFGIRCYYQGSQRILPIKDAEYCKYTFKFEDVVYDLVGASHLNTYRGIINIYVLKSVAETNNWNGKLNTWAAACPISGWTTWATS